MFQRGSLAAAAVVLLAAGCSPDLDTTRDAGVRGSFGETMYREACERVAWTSQLDDQQKGLRATVDVTGDEYRPVCVDDAPPPADAPQRLVALTGQRALLVAAIDRILPPDFLDPLEQFLESIVGLSDDGTMEDIIGKMAALVDTLKSDDAFTGALAHVSGRSGYRPAETSNLVQAVVDYPALDDFLSKSTSVFLDDMDQPTPEFATLLDAVSHELRGATALPQPASQTRTLRLALDLFFSESDDFATGRPLLLTRRDWRGVAQVVPAQDGSLPAPFVDNNGDGLPDIDDHGRFVGADARPLAIGTPFPVGAGDNAKRDAQGRLLDGDGQPLLDYVDLDRTFFAAAQRELPPLLDPAKDNALGLLWGAGALLGPRVKKSKTYPNPTGGQLSLSWNGFDTSKSALLDLLHAFLQILGDPNAQDLLLATKTLLTQHEDPATRLVAAMFDANDRGKQHA